MRAAIYTRLSFVARDAEAAGIDRQEADCRRLVEARGWELVEVYREPDVSAFRDVPRPEFERMRRAVADGDVGVVVAWKLDRAFRRLKEAVDFLEDCREHSVAFVSATEGIDTTTPYGGVLFALFSALAQIESQTKSDRIARWHQQRAERGLPTGGGTRAYGFEPDGVKHRAAEARLIRDAIRSLLNGGTLTGIARNWNDRGILTPTGKRWSKTSLRRIVLSPRIAGLRQHRDETFPAAWKPIITEDEHLRLRARYGSPGRPAGRRYVLAGVAFCGLCGTRLIARPKADGRRCYVCASDQGGCGKIRQLAAPLEEFVAGRVDDHYTTARVLSDEPDEPIDAESLRRQIEADERALEDLARDRYVTRSIGDAEFRAVREPLVNRIADAQEHLARLAEPRWSDLLRSDGPAPWEVPPGTDPDPDDFAYWRRWIGDAVDRVEIGPAVRGRNFFDKDRVQVVWKA
jgi:site-specific DNA recombinase